MRALSAELPGDKSPHSTAHPHINYSLLSLRISNLLVPWLVKLMTIPFFASAVFTASRNCFGVVTAR